MRIPAVVPTALHCGRAELNNSGCSLASLTSGLLGLVSAIIADIYVAASLDVLASNAVVDVLDVHLGLSPHAAPPIGVTCLFLRIVGRRIGCPLAPRRLGLSSHWRTCAAAALAGAK